MRATNVRRGRLGSLLILALVVLVVILVLAPSVAAAGFGRLVADLWVSTMAAIAGLLGGIIGS